jgi:dimethylglycine dehydrogenase
MSSRCFGAYAMNSLRMEKAYRAWGGELTNEITMIEADMERFVNFDKEFIGRAATLASAAGAAHKACLYGGRRRRQRLPRQRADHARRAAGRPHHRGRLWLRGGEIAHLRLSRAALVAEGAEFDIALLGETCKARIIAQPAYDPANARLKA